MVRALRRGVIVLALALVGAQAFRIDRTNPPVTGDVGAPAEVAALLRRACYDCHSNETVWPWYARVAPASWLLASDVREGRGDLNFSTWTAYGVKKQVKKLQKTAEEVGEGDMPPWDYALMHPEARLTDAERAALRAWTAVEIARLSAPAAP